MAELMKNRKKCVHNIIEHCDVDFSAIQEINNIEYYNNSIEHQYNLLYHTCSRYTYFDLS